MIASLERFRACMVFQSNNAQNNLSYLKTFSFTLFQSRQNDRFMKEEISY